MKIKKKFLFNFGFSSVCKIYLKCTFSNVFITITDMDDKVVMCKSCGSSGVTGTKRRKKAPQAVEQIVSKLNDYLKLYKIINIEVILPPRYNRKVPYLVRELLFYGYKIKKFFVRQIFPHNGVRGRKLKRR